MVLTYFYWIYSIRIGKQGMPLLFLFLFNIINYRIRQITKRKFMNKIAIILKHSVDAPQGNITSLLFLVWCSKEVATKNESILPNIYITLKLKEKICACICELGIDIYCQSIMLFKCICCGLYTFFKSAIQCYLHI